MSDDPSPLKYMGTQSHETMAMEAAMAHRAGHATEQAADSKLSDKLDATSHSRRGRRNQRRDQPGHKRGADTLRSVAGYARERATTTLETYAKADPIKAILIAVGTGAALMGLVAMMARSGARTVRRNVQG